MDIKAKKEFIKLFNQGFEEVVLPSIEGLERELKSELKVVRGKLGTVEDRLVDVEDRLGSLEGRVGQMDRKLDYLSDKSIDYGTRLKAIESASSTAHQIKRK